MTRRPLNLKNTDDLGRTLRRCYIDSFLDEQISSWEDGLLVLDLGGNKTGKRGWFDIGLFSHRVVCVNLVTDKSPDVQADAHLLPFADAVFDAIVCAEVLEHVQCPEVVLHEARRVLKGNGRLLVTAPFLAPVHGDPDDYGRYTETYWRETLAASGFSLLSVSKQGLFWSVLLDMLRDFVANSGGRAEGFWWRPLRAVLSWGVKWGRRLAFRAEAGTRLGRQSFAERYTTGFAILARKPHEHVAEVKL